MLTFTTAMSAQGAPVSVDVQALRSDEGVVACALFAQKDGFPGDGAKAKQRVSCNISHQTALCTFSDIPEGTYAVACIHDENANDKLDTNFIGIPREGIAASKDAKSFMGPPKFKDAQWTHGAADETIQVHMTYY